MKREHEPLRVLLADDEPPALSALRMMVEKLPEFAVICTCANGPDTIRALREHDVQIALLDIEMPGATGLEIARSIAPDRMPVIVFVTAYDEYAVPAFDVEAVDYVLKPVDEPRLVRALARARDRILARSVPSTDPLPLRTALGTVLADLDAVDRVEASGSYVRVHVGSEVHLLRETLSAFIDRLDDRFYRIHRSSVVHLRRIRKLRGATHGDAIVELHDGTELRVSRSRRSELERRLRGGKS